MSRNHEEDRRQQAIQWYEQETGFNEIVRTLRCSRSWLSKWLARYREYGREGLSSRSTAPRRVWRKTPERSVAAILAVRDELQAHATRRTAFAGIGAEVIHWELMQRHYPHVPSIATIGRILKRQGRTDKPKPVPSGGSSPYPAPQVQRSGDLHQTDIVGPRHLKGVNGAIRFYSFHTIDVAGRMVHASQSPDKRTISLCRHLVAAWSVLGVPRISQLDNEMSATGGGRYRYSISQLIRLHLLLGIHVVFVPQGEPGRNATVESFNHLWQQRVLRRHTCPDLPRLRRTSDRFLQYYHYRKPHRALAGHEQGSRFPGVLRDACWERLRHLPEHFRLTNYTDDRGNLTLPIARGKVSFIRKVDSNGRIEVNGASYFIRRKLERHYVVATIEPHRKRLIVTDEGKRIKTFPFPILQRTISPLL